MTTHFCINEEMNPLSKAIVIRAVILFLLKSVFTGCKDLFKSKKHKIPSQNFATLFQSQAHH